MLESLLGLGDENYRMASEILAAEASSDDDDSNGSDEDEEEEVN